MDEQSLPSFRKMYVSHIQTHFHTVVAQYVQADCIAFQV